MSKSNKKAFVFIDGGNFYFRLKDLVSKVDGKYSLLDFDFYGFCKEIVKPDNFIGVKYYIGVVKRRDGNEKSEELYANQQRLIARLKNKNIDVVLGNVIQHPDNTYHEKGVDVRIAVEMIRLARKNVYNRAYLISSDTDLVPAVEEVHSFNKEVYYVGTPKAQSFGLTKESDNTILLRPEDVRNFLPPSLL